MRADLQPPSVRLLWALEDYFRVPEAASGAAAWRSSSIWRNGNSAQQAIKGSETKPKQEWTNWHVSWPAPGPAPGSVPATDLGPGPVGASGGLSLLLFVLLPGIICHLKSAWNPLTSMCVSQMWTQIWDRPNHWCSSASNWDSVYAELFESSLSHMTRHRNTFTGDSLQHEHTSGSCPLQ